MADGELTLEVETNKAKAANLNGVSGPGVSRFEAVPKPVGSGEGNGLLSNGLNGLSGGRSRSREEELAAQGAAALPNYRPVGLEENRTVSSGTDNRKFRQEHAAGGVETHEMKPSWLAGPAAIVAGLARTVMAIGQLGMHLVPMLVGKAVALVKFLAQPETLALIGAGLKVAGDVSWEFLKALFRLDLVTVSKMVWQLGKFVVSGLSNFIGLTDILQSGLCLVTGDLKGAKDHFLKGGSKFLEATGVKDCWLFLKCLWEGDGIAAGDHLFNAALSVGAIWASIATMGAASHSIFLATIGKQAAKDAAVQVFKLSGKAIGQLVVGEIDARAGVKIAQELTPKLVDRGAAVLATQVRTHGADVLDISMQGGKRAGLIRDTYYQELANGMAREILEALELKKVQKLVKSEVHRTLLEVDRLKEKKFAELLMERFGIEDKKLAKKLANSSQHVLKSRGNDKLLGETLEEVITQDVGNYLKGKMKSPFMKRLAKHFSEDGINEDSKILRGAAEANAKRLGQSVDNLVDDYVHAGWEGVEAGLDDFVMPGVRAMIKKGIKDGFKEFRKGKKWKLFKRHKDNHGHASVIGEEGADEAAEAAKKFKEREDAIVRAEPGDLPVRHIKVKDPGTGAEYLVEEQRLADGRWREIARELLSEGEKKAA